MTPTQLKQKFLGFFHELEIFSQLIKQLVNVVLVTEVNGVVHG